MRSRNDLDGVFARRRTYNTNHVTRAWRTTNIYERVEILISANAYAGVIKVSVQFEIF